MASPYPQSLIPEPYQRMVRSELRKIPAWKLQEVYGKLKAGESTGIELVERNRAYAISAVEEILWERGKLPKSSHSSGVALTTRDEWARAYEHIVPLIGVGLATVSIVMGFMTLSRPVGQRIYYQDGEYLISVRFPGQWYDLREFITPLDAEVQRVLFETGHNLERCLDFVCRNTRYQSDIIEFWKFPSETLLSGAGDCEDSTFAFVSLAQNFDPDVWAILGDYMGFGHAWAARNGVLYETTYTSARQVKDPQNYRALVAFNHYDICEVYPGALAEVFDLGRDEEVKLNLMAEAVGDEVPPECPSCWPFLLTGLATGGIIGTGFAMILQKGE